MFSPVLNLSVISSVNVFSHLHILVLSHRSLENDVLCCQCCEVVEALYRVEWGESYGFSPLVELKRKGEQYFFIRSHRREDYSYPFLAIWAVIGGINREMGQGLGRLLFAKPWRKHVKYGPLIAKSDSAFTSLHFQ